MPVSNKPRHDALTPAGAVFFEKTWREAAQVGQP
jgi:hypothetical protein